MTLAEAAASLQCVVIYRPNGGRCEYGSITSVNDKYVFVRYEGCQNSQATRPEDLTLLSKVGQ